MTGPPEDGAATTWRERVAPYELDWRSILLIPALAVVAALAVGAIFILMTEGPGAIWPAYSALVSGSLGGMTAISETLLVATPLILAGLSVAFGFQAGLFNIGAEGQMTIGGLVAAIVGFSMTGLPPVIHLPLALLAGIAGGLLWGFVPGFLLARTGAHEVITTIMLNFVAFRTLDYVLRQPGIQREGRFDPISKDVLDSAQLPRLLSDLPLDSASRLRVHLGFVIALAVAGLIWWLIFRSTIGFELRAVGANPTAAAYGGMSLTKGVILAMAIAGALGGLAGANETLGVTYNAQPGFTAQKGFDAIALALLGRSHPAGVVLAALLFGALRVGGRAMQVRADVGVDLILIVQSLIVIFIAAPELVRAIFRVRGGKGAGQLTRGWGT